MLHPALMELVKDDLEEGREKGREQGREQGRKEGREEGRKEGIVNLVDVYRVEMGLDDETITDKIAARFHLTRGQAANYVRAQEA